MPEPVREARLSFAQERLWFLSRFEPGSPVYNVSRAVRCRGPLDIESLRRALNAVVVRHEALRTIFRDTERGPKQVVTPPAEIPLPVLDVAEASLQETLEQAASQSVDLSRGPIVRTALYRLGPQEHVLLLLIHHIACDGWSLSLLFRELGELYEADQAGRAPLLPALSIQYADFAEWHRGWLQGPLLDQEVEWWRNRLAGLPPVLPLFTDFPRPARRSSRGADLPVVIPAELAARLRSFSRASGVTLYMTLLAAFQLLLHRYTGQGGICVGSPIANRTRTETESLIGFFVNTLAWRADLPEGLTFRQLVQRGREAAFDVYEHQHLPFEKLVEALDPERSLSHTPLIQAVFVLQNAGEMNLLLPGVETKTSHVSTHTAKFDLTLTLEDHRSGPLDGEFNFSTDLYRASTVERMFAHYLTLLDGALAAPDQPVSTLPLLTPPERRQLLADWNDTRRPYPQTSVHGLFESQAARRPDAVAVACGARRLTYAELSRASTRLAEALVARGVAPGGRVGLRLERSLEMVIALLGVLKAGAAYVPLDPAYPPQRLRLLVEDSGVGLVLTSADIEQMLARPAATEPPALARVAPDSPAYVIYTSGSSGVPKGVEVLHRGIVRLLCGVSYVPFGEDQVFLQLASLSFDASTFEIWGALLHGGRLVLYPGRFPVATELGRVLQDEGVTTLLLTPSLFNSIVEEAPGVLAPVRWLLVGGEALSAPHIRRALEALPSTEIVNAYGPTESTVIACCYLIPRPLPAGWTSIPIGRSIANTRVYVLDGHRQPVPVGVPGELFIGGDGVARGYLNRPDLTAGAFQPDPFDSTPGARMYRTGDRVRYLPEGNLEFLDRLDEQVKLRGFRIEVGEIEAALRSHPAVQSACVLLRTDEAGDRCLVAYFTAVSGRDPGEPALREHLEARLPAYMVPARFVLLDALPLGPNGKVDRAALPHPPARSSASAPDTFRDPLELRLLSIWRDVLHTGTVGFADNFFDFGGHSLLALHLLSKVERAFGRRLTLPELFEAPTVERQATLLRRHSAKGLDRQVSVLHPHGSRPPFFCIDAGPRFLALARTLDAGRPFLGIWPDAAGGVPSSRRVEDFARVALCVIREIQPHGPYLLGGWCVAGLAALEVAQQLREAGEPTALVVLLDSFNPAAPRPSPWRNVQMQASRVAFHLPRMAHGQFPNLREYLRQHARAFARAAHIAPLPGLVTAALDYRPRPYAGRVLLARPAERPRHPGWDAAVGWSTFLTGDFQVCDIPGTHESMLQRPAVDALAAVLRSCLP
jgi:amino acid adenylation domain-containing protein